MGLVHVLEGATYSGVGDGTAAQWTLNQNVFEGNFFEVDSVPRRVVRVGFVGSDAKSEAKINITYGGMKVAETWNNAGASAAVQGDDMHVIMSKRVCRAGEPIGVVLREVASTTNPYHIVLDIKDIIRRRRGRRRWRRRRY